MKLFFFSYPIRFYLESEGLKEALFMKWLTCTTPVPHCPQNLFLCLLGFLLMRFSSANKRCCSRGQTHNKWLPHEPAPLPKGSNHTPRDDSQTGTKSQQLTGKTNLARGHFQLPFLCRLGHLTIPLMSLPPVWTIFHKVTPALLNVRAQLLSLVRGSPQVLSWGTLACLATPSFTALRMNLLQASLWWGLVSSDAFFPPCSIALLFSRSILLLKKSSTILSQTYRRAFLFNNHTV